MEVGIISCVWKRPKLDQVFLQQVERFRKRGINVIIVGSQDEEYAHQFPNNPLGAKWNYALSLAKDFDYVIAAGSDDFISEAALDVYYSAMKKGIDFIGMLDYYIYYGRLGYWAGYKPPLFAHRQGETVGAFRCFSKRLLTELNYDLWSGDINLDNHLTSKMKEIRHSQFLINGQFAVGVKYEQSITAVKNIKLKRVTPDLLIQVPEHNAIRKLFHK